MGDHLVRPSSTASRSSRRSWPSLVREVTDRPGALPLLQYTLTELFDSRRGDRVDFATYEMIGGVSGALVKRAEGLLASLGDAAHEVARQVFLRLVTFNDGGEDTRRRVLRSELEDLDVDRLVLRSVLDTFGRHRLLSFDRDPITRSPTVEISHEALLTEWIRLRDWIDGAAARRPCATPTRGSDARMDRRRPGRRLPPTRRSPRTGGRLGRHDLGAAVRPRTGLPRCQPRRTRP